MKYLPYILILFSFLFLNSCDMEDKVPELTPINIHRQFKTETMAVKLSELKDFIEYRDKIFIVNSIDELPEDKYFGTDNLKKANINFSEYSLIIVYQLLMGEITSYKYNWFYNNWFSRYELNIAYDRIKDSEYNDGEIENFTYIRSAILVRHIPKDSICIISTGIYSQQSSS